MQGPFPRPLALFVLSLVAAVFVEGQQPLSGGLPPGAKLFVAEMEWKLDRAIVAEIGRQRLPVQVVTDPREAAFTMTAVYQNLGSRTTSPGHYIQAKIVAADGKPVWATEVRDFGVVFAQLQPHGRERAAKAIVRRLAISDKSAGKRAGQAEAR
jgi:exosome complex RNA-binding protein Csl4